VAVGAGDPILALRPSFSIKAPRRPPASRRRLPRGEPSAKGRVFAHSRTFKALSLMKISGVDIRPGNILEYEKGIWKVAKTQHTQPGKGGAFMQVEMKNLIDGRKTNVRFRSQDTIERVRLDTKDFQYLYKDGDALVFMDKDTYDQINLPAELIGEAASFLQDGMMVSLELYDERPISVALPETVEATIVEADAVVKGQTASSSFKPAILDNGVRVMVPPHIGSGTRIVVDVYERTYVGKAG
jgi:elongation factor P